MTIKKKGQKHQVFVQTNITENEEMMMRVIDRGGKTSSESVKMQESNDREVRFTLRIAQELIQKIDERRKKKIGNISRNQWILEAIENSLKE